MSNDRRRGGGGGKRGAGGTMGLEHTATIWQQRLTYAPHTATPHTLTRKNYDAMGRGEYLFYSFAINVTAW